MATQKAAQPESAGCARRNVNAETCGQLFLPGALFMAISAKLLATFMFIDFGFTTFF
jgi:hypothetical protein